MGNIGFVPFKSTAEIVKETSVATAAFEKKIAVNNAAIAKDLKHSYNVNRSRQPGEVAQDLGSLGGRVALSLGQLGFGTLDTAAHVASFGNLDLNALTADSEGTTLSEKFQLSREILKDSESDPFKARQQELSNRRAERGEADIAFDATNPTTFENFSRGVSNFGSSVSDQVEFATVAADTIAESLPLAVIPGGLTTQFTKQLASAAGKKFVAANTTKQGLKNAATKSAAENAKKGATAAQNKAAGEAGVKAALKKLEETGGRLYLASDKGVAAVNKLALTTGLGFNAVSEGISNSGEVHASILGSSEEKLTADSSEYRALRKQNKSHIEARRIIANKARNITAGIAGLLGGIASKVTGAAKLEGLGFKIDSKLGKSILGKIATGPVLEGATREGVEETLQGAAGTFAGNVAESLTSDDDKKLSADVVEASAQGLVAGVGSGGGLAGLANLPKNIKNTAEAVGKGAKVVSDVAAARKLTPAAKQAVKNKDITGVTDTEAKDHDPITAAQASLHKDILETKKDDLDAHLQDTQGFIDAATDNQVNLLAKLQGIATKLKGLFASKKENPDDTSIDNDIRVLHAELEEGKAELREMNKVLPELRERFSVLSAEAPAKANKAAQEVKDKLLGTKVGDVDPDTDLETSDTQTETTKGQKLDDGEEETIYGNGNGLLLNGEKKDLKAIISSPLAPTTLKKRASDILDIRNIADSASDVTREIINGNPSDNALSEQKTGILTHVQRVLNNANTDKAVKAYEKFKTGIKLKTDAATELRDALDKTPTTITPERQTELEESIGIVEGLDIQGDPVKNVAAFAQSIVTGNEAALIAFDRADTMIEEGQNPNTPAAETTRTTGTNSEPSGASRIPDSEEEALTRTYLTAQTTKELDTSIQEFRSELKTLGQTPLETVDRAINIETAERNIQIAEQVKADAAVKGVSTRVADKLAANEKAATATKAKADKISTLVSATIETLAKPIRTLKGLLNAKGGTFRGDKITGLEPSAIAEIVNEENLRSELGIDESIIQEDDIAEAFLAAIVDNPTGRLPSAAIEGINLDTIDADSVKGDKDYPTGTKLGDLSLRNLLKKVAENPNRKLSPANKAIIAIVNKQLEEANPKFLADGLDTVSETAESDSSVADVDTKAKTEPVPDNQTEQNKEDVAKSQSVLKSLQEANDTNTSTEAEQAAIIAENVLNSVGNGHSVTASVNAAIANPNTTKGVQLFKEQLAKQGGINGKFTEAPTAVQSFIQRLLTSTALVGKKLKAATLRKVGNKFKDIPNVLSALYTEDKKSESLLKGTVDLFANDNFNGFEEAAKAKLGVESLTDNQAAGLVHMWDFVQSFMTKYKDTHKTINNDLQNIQRHPMSYFFEEIDGELALDDSVIAALGISAFEYINNTMQDNVQIDVDLVKSLLGIKEKDAQLDNGIMKVFGGIGTTASQLAPQMGATFLGAVGIKPKKTTDLNEQATMALDAGNHVLDTLIQMEIVERRFVRSSLFDAAKNSPETFQTFYNSVQDKDSLVRAESSFVKGNPDITFIKPVIEETADGQRKLPATTEELSKSLNDTDSMGFKLFGIQNSESDPVFTKPSDDGAKQRTNDGATAVNSEQAEIVHRESQSPVILNKSELNAFRLIGREKMLELIRTPIADQTVHGDNIEAQRAKTEKLERSIEAMFTFIERPEFEKDSAAEFYVTKEFWSNYRVGEETNTISPQSDRAISRSLVSYKEHNIEIDPAAPPREYKDSDGNVVGTFDPNLGFKFAIMQAFGINVDKVTNATIITEFNKLVDGFTNGIKSSDTTSAIQFEILSSLADGIALTQEQTDNLDTIITPSDRDGKDPLLRMNGLFALQAYVTAQGSKSTFTSNIHYEVDGITNGFAITLLQMPTVDIKVPSNEVPSMLINLIEQGVFGEDATSNDLSKYVDSGGKLTENGQALFNNNTDKIQAAMLGQRLEKTGVFNADSTYSTAGDFISTGSNLDSYADLSNSMLNNLNDTNTLLAPENAGNITAAAQALSRLASLLGATKKLGLNTTIEHLIDINFFSDLPDYSSDKMSELYGELSGAEKDILKGLPTSLLQSIGKLKGVAPADVSKVISDRLAAVTELVGALKDDETDSDHTGFKQFAINGAGRNLAKPSLLISNYGASISNIMRTFSSEVVDGVGKGEGIRSALVEIAILFKEANTVEAAQNKLADLNASIGALVPGTPLFTKDNLLKPLNTNLNKSIQKIISDTYGEVLKATLETKYSDMFDARKKLNSTTQLTFELFDRYKSFKRQQLLDKHGVSELTVEQDAEFNKSLISFAPYYETYFSSEFEEGVFGPNMSTQQQIGNYAYRVESKTGSAGFNGFAGLPKISSPSVRVPVMLTHAMDAAVQTLFMKALRKEMGIAYLNVHDAAGIGAVSPEIAVPLYNKAYMQVMHEYSLADAIADPLVRIYEQMKKETPFLLDTYSNEIKGHNKKGDYDLFKAFGGFAYSAPHAFTDIDRIVNTMSYERDLSNSRKERLLSSSDLNVTQYSIGNVAGHKYTFDKDTFHSRNTTGNTFTLTKAEQDVAVSAKSEEGLKLLAERQGILENRLVDSKKKLQSAIDRLANIKNPKIDTTPLQEAIDAAQEDVANSQETLDEIKDFLSNSKYGSGPVSLDVENFTATQDTHIDANNSTRVFNALASRGNKTDSPEHTARLKDMLNDVINKVVKKIRIRVREQGNETLGAYSNKRGIFLSLAGRNTTAPNHSSAMSAQEAYVHEVTHSVIAHTLNTDSKLANKVVRFYDEAVASGKLTPDLFMPAGMVKGDAMYDTELAIATERLQYIINNTGQQGSTYIDPVTGRVRKSKLSDGIHEFMTFSVTNEAFIERLKTIPIKNKLEVKANASLFEKALELVEAIFNYFNTSFGRLPPKTADVVAMSLFTELATVQKENENKTTGLTDHVLDATSQVYNVAYNATIGTVLDKARDLALKSLPKKMGKSEVVRQLYNPNNIYGNLNSAGKSLVSSFGAEHDGLLLQLFNELNPRSERNSFVHTGLRNKNKSIDKAIQKITVNMKALFGEAFDTELTLEQKAHITKAVIRTDLQSLAGTYTPVQIKKLLDGKGALDAEIAKLAAAMKTEYKGNAAFYNIMANNLGHYAATGVHRSRATANNAWLIANMKNTTGTVIGDVVQAEKDIDVLATLYTLKHTELTARNTLSTLIETDAGGIDTLLDVLKINNEHRVNIGFGGNKAQMRKGFMTDSYSKHVQFRIGEDSDTQAMKSQGYRKEMPLTNDSPDGSPKKFIFVNRYADLTSRTSGAISLRDDHAKGTFLEEAYLKKAQTAYSESMAQALLGKDFLASKDVTVTNPVFNDNGDAVNFRYTMNNALKESLLEIDLDFTQVVSKLETSHMVRNRTHILNRELMQAAFDEYTHDTGIKKDPHLYAAIGPNAPGKLKEYWHMLPDETKRDARAIWGKNEIILPKDAIIMAFGQPKWSTQHLKPKDLSLLTGRERLFGSLNNTVAALLNTAPVNFMESILREAVGVAADAIVVKSGIVLLGNEASNMLTLKTMGVPYRDIISGQLVAIKAAKEYAITSDKVMQARLKLRSSDRLSPVAINNINASIVRWEHLLTISPVVELMDAGIHQTLIEDVNIADESVGNMGRIEKKLRGNKIVKSLIAASEGKYANLFVKAGSEVLMTHNSATYKFLKDGTQLSDFAARHVLHEHNKKGGMGVAESIAVIEDTFINYDIPSHPFLQLGNDLGFMMFTKFFFRIQPVIWNLATNHPRRFLLMLLAQGLVGDIEDVSDAVLSFRHLANKFGDPLSLILDIPETPLISGSLFGG